MVYSRLQRSFPFCINVKGTIKPGYGSSKRPFKSRPFAPRKKRKKIQKDEDESEASEPEEATSETEETEDEVQKEASEESDPEPEIELNLSQGYTDTRTGLPSNDSYA